MTEKACESGVSTGRYAYVLITLMAFKNHDENSAGLAQTVFRWTMANMWDEKGYFYYRVLSLLKVRISYMRRTQAWMLLALSVLIDNFNQVSISLSDSGAVAGRASPNIYRPISAARD
jgi:hypothetical protein